jgi:hypothetical protein
MIPLDNLTDGEALNLTEKPLFNVVRLIYFGRDVQSGFGSSLPSACDSW